MARQITCEICSKQVIATNGKQKTCLSSGCQRKLRSKSRSKKYYVQRRSPNCVWCGEPILEPRKRKYHTECREDKNRLRVREYDKTRRQPASQKKPRDYKSYLRCQCCKKKVKRTGARQLVCQTKECVNWLKRENKRKLKERKAIKAEILRKKMNKARPDSGRTAHNLLLRALG